MKAVTPESQSANRSRIASNVAAPARARKLLWIVTSGLSGLVIMTLELAAFRLYAPHFGYSIYVWGSMIGVIMAALSAGYALGGWAADASRGDRLLYLGIVLSTAWQLVMLLTMPSFLPALAEAGEIAGPIFATLILFLVPMVLLAATGPFVTRLLARAGHIGSTAGLVSAVSTIGSLVGVFGTSFYLVPTFGTRATLAVACALSSITGAAGLLSRRTSGAAAVALGLIVALPMVPRDPRAQGTIWSAESVYNLVRVVRRRGATMLMLNRDWGAHTVRNDASTFTGLYFDQFALGPLLATRSRRALVLGMGGGSSIATLRLAAPDIQVDAVEIDPKVIEAAERFFNVGPDDPRLRVHLGDARRWLRGRHEQWDIVQLDLYQGGPYVPFYLATVEYFDLVHSHLTQGGVLMMNLLDASPERSLLNATVATLRRAFPGVLCIPCGEGSFIICGFQPPRTLEWFRRSLAVPSRIAGIRDLARRAAAEAFIPPFDRQIAPMTDDRSNIEELTRRMLATIRVGQALPSAPTASAPRR